MKITKYGHACMLIEEGDARILIDPGTFSSDADVENLDAILITHNHQDHLDSALISKLIEMSPEVQVITVAEAGKNLADAGIAYTTIEDDGEVMLAGVSVRSFGKHHSYIYGEMPKCQNTGFMIANRFYHPGDSFHQPNMSVEILALPVAGPWMKIAEAIDYAKAVKPKVVIPMHDWFIRPEATQMLRSFPKTMLETEDITFCDLTDGSSAKFDP
jgi:L-ascorbate metabolism protein UlaG (beta-lactamase superfamily)